MSSGAAGTSPEHEIDEWGFESPYDRRALEPSSGGQVESVPESLDWQEMEGYTAAGYAAEGDGARPLEAEQFDSEQLDWQETEGYAAAGYAVEEGETEFLRGERRSREELDSVEQLDTFEMGDRPAESHNLGLPLLETWEEGSEDVEPSIGAVDHDREGASFSRAGFPPGIGPSLSFPLAPYERGLFVDSDLAEESSSLTDAGPFEAPESAYEEAPSFAGPFEAPESAYEEAPSFAGPFEAPESASVRMTAPTLVGPGDSVAQRGMGGGEDEMVLLREAESIFEKAAGVARNAGDFVKTKGRIQGGILDENELTNLVFWDRHPSRAGQKLKREDPEFKTLSAEWIAIRDRIVRPALSAGGNSLSCAPTTQFKDMALRRLPDVLQVKPLARLECLVPTDNVLRSGLLEQAEAMQSDWGLRLLVAPDDLPEVVPQVKLHVELFKMVPIDPRIDRRVWWAFASYFREAYGSDTPYILLTVADPRGSKTVDTLMGGSSASLYAAAGLPHSMTGQQAAEHKLLIVVAVPRTMDRVLAPRDFRLLDDFEFDKWRLRDWHQRQLQQVAKEIIGSWNSPMKVHRIVVSGHTDERGEPPYNLSLGKKRAEAVEAALRRELDQQTPQLMKELPKRLRYDVLSYGESHRVSRREHRRNRRVEILLLRQITAHPQPLPLPTVLSRLTALLERDDRLKSDSGQRIRCIIETMSQTDVDDRWARHGQVFHMNRDNRVPTPTEWNRARFYLTDPTSFGPTIPDGKVVENLLQLDRDIVDGVVEMNRIIDRANVKWKRAPLGWLALSDAFKRFNSWLFERFKDEKSLYHCYRSRFVR